MKGEGEYQHFIPKFILRKYDANYEEPDLAAYRANPQYHKAQKLADTAWEERQKEKEKEPSVSNKTGQEKEDKGKKPSVADKKWEKEKKDRQKRSSVHTVSFETISSSNASEKVIEARRALKDQRKIKKDAKRLKMGKFDPGTVSSANFFECDAEAGQSVEISPDGGFLEIVDKKDEMELKIQGGRLDFCHQDVGLRLEERNPNSICGLIDMYGQKQSSGSCEDNQQATKKAKDAKCQIESEFSKLEKRMADLVKVLEKDVADRKTYSRLSQDQLHQVHHFLFIMFYRGSNFFNHYNSTIEAYKGGDKAELLRYMEANGLDKPLDVWYHNLRKFISLSPWPDLQAWEAGLRAGAYPADAWYFIDRVKNYVLCFCRPKEADDAFILTQNAFSVFDGCRESKDTRWAPFHFFAPIGPKFLMLLRRRSMFSHIGRTSSPDQFEPYSIQESSWLRHLPIGRQPFQHRDDFYLIHHHIPSIYVLRINAIFLRSMSNLIIYSTDTSLIRALRCFCEEQGPMFAAMVLGVAEPRILYSGDEVRRIGGGQPIMDGQSHLHLMYLSKILALLEELCL